MSVTAAAKWAWRRAVVDGPGGGAVGGAPTRWGRRPGRASAVVAPATGWCLDHDLVPIYLVAVQNTGSVMLAESLGFRRQSEEINVTVRGR